MVRTAYIVDAICNPNEAPHKSPPPPHHTQPVLQCAVADVTPLLSQEIVTIFDVVLSEIYVESYPDDSDPSVNVQVRTYNMATVTCMRNLNPSDMDKLVSIKGMIIRTSNIIPDIQRAFFQCLNCNTAEEVDIMNGRIQEPSSCKKCKATQSLEIKHNRCLFKDKQLIRLQVPPPTPLLSPARPQI